MIPKKAKLYLLTSKVDTAVVAEAVFILTSTPPISSATRMFTSRITLSGFAIREREAATTSEVISPLNHS